MKRTLADLRTRHFGSVYITDADGPMPWNRLPSYWEQLLIQVKQVNQQ